LGIGEKDLKGEHAGKKNGFERVKIKLNFDG
jgi:hypothetical protein